MSIALRTRLLRRLPPRLQPALKLLRIATARGGLPAAARLRLLTVAPRLLGSSTRGPDVSVPLLGGPVFLGGESLYIDALTLNYLWGEGVFSTDWRDRVVVDLGAHKGYFGAWALANGATFVLSCEPSSSNFARLERARRDNVRSAAWDVQRVAVGRTEGVASLHVSSESWGHSIQAGMVDSVSKEQVRVVTLAGLLQQLDPALRDLDIVLKVNVEGSAADILAPAPAEVLHQVVEIHLDHEPGSPYDLDHLLHHLAQQGLDSVERLREKIYVVRRSVPRSRIVRPLLHTDERLTSLVDRRRRVLDLESEEHLDDGRDRHDVEHHRPEVTAAVDDEQ